jgi:transglutaminase-like putative cysteine protease
MLIKLNIHHRTTYRYREPVRLLPHRLMLRPRESHELRLVTMNVAVTPPALVTWASDVAGNTVATAIFETMVDSLTIDSAVELELDTATWPVFDIAASAISFPFRYSDDEWMDLGALATPQSPDPSGRVHAWARAFIYSSPTDTLSLLKDINAGTGAGICYVVREEEGTQTAEETLERGSGSCRDLAVLFVEAVRHLGFGARVVSGYLYNPLAWPEGGRATHAWAEVYVPGAGWITFDPTNRSVGGTNLIPVAVGRDMRQVMPVVGSFVGMTDAFQGLWVEVSVTS